MKQPDQSLREVTDLLDAGKDVDAVAVLERLAEQTEDPTLRRELEELVASGRASTHGFRKAWDRLYLAYTVGR